MNLSIKVMRISDKEVKMVSNEELEKLSDKIWNEIVRVNNEEEERNEIINEMEDIM